MTLALLPLLLPACAKPKSDTLIIGMEMKYPPFEMKDATGAPAGVSVDLARALAAHLGKPVRIEDMAFDSLIPMLKTGKVDLIVSSMTATAERAKSIDFSDPYATAGLCLLTGKDSRVRESGDLDQPGITVAVKSGTTGHVFTEAGLKHAGPRVLDDADACVVEVIQGKADAFIYDQLSILRYWKIHPDRTRALLSPIQTEPWAIGIRKGRPELLKSVNAFLADFRKSGGFDRLAAKHLAGEKREFEERGIPFLF